MALVVPPPASTEIDGLRRALGDRDRERIEPHVTLVPPLNLRVDELATALSVLRDAAAAVDGPVPVRLGPPRTFAPRGPVLFLAVRPPADQRDLDLITRMHRQALRGPLERPLVHRFVPHCTLRVDVPADRVDPALDALGDYDVDVTLPRVQLLREHRPGPGVHRWRLLADVGLGPRRVVGRGGLPVELTRSTVLDPEAAASLLGWPLLPDDVDPGPAPADQRSVVARREDRVVGLLTARRDGPRLLVDRVAVADEARAHGIGELLLAELEALAVDEALPVVDVPDADEVVAVRDLLGDRGFEPTADHAGRRVARRRLRGPGVRPTVEAGRRTAGGSAG